MNKIAIMISILVMSIILPAYADSNMDPSSDTVSGTSAINDNGASNGLVQGSDAIQDHEQASNGTDLRESGIIRDGETMDEED